MSDIKDIFSKINEIEENVKTLKDLMIQEYPGEGRLLQPDDSGKRFHGITERSARPSGFEKHCFAEYRLDHPLPHKSWDTHDHSTFCTNCVLHKVNTISKFYRCLGH